VLYSISHLQTAFSEISIKTGHITQIFTTLSLSSIDTRDDSLTNITTKTSCYGMGVNYSVNELKLHWLQLKDTHISAENAFASCFFPPSPCPKIPEDVHKQGNFFKKTLFTSKCTRNFFFSPRDLKCQHYCLFVNFHTQIQDALEGSVTSFVLCHHSSYSYCALLLLYLPFNTNSLTWLKLNNDNKNNWFPFSRCQGISDYGQKHNFCQ